MIEKLRGILITRTKVGLKKMAGLALRASGRPKMGRTSANTLPTVRPLNPGRAPGSARWAARRTHIALARKPSPDASGLPPWARATS